LLTAPLKVTQDLLTFRLSKNVYVCGLDKHTMGHI